MENMNNNLVSLDLSSLWDRIFTVNPLVIIGSMDDEDTPNFAPKHMAFPIGWDNYFGFVCTPNHSTYSNIKKYEEFTVTYPKPDQVTFTSLTATQRRQDDTKPELETIPRFQASEVNSYFLEEGYFYLECSLMEIIDGFGVNSLIVGEVIKAYADEDYIRKNSRDDNDLIYSHPLLAYLHPGRFAIVDESQAFPFPKKFKK
ncbi:flavin reductase family protein [Aliifodinibius sp. S!AR15-10]|uniref:flavin reductase family protein n=1 Tax=Aliifodinibius sp. S!AR15-10 TaxID=2950437 RepID=UPI00285D5E3D|nr:flavin reductase [Aliifodinibius sp. S!AR15-10]MDR8389649.1 flavin reductase family protein [Aliifodinibius sp. S!AR15-10]